MAKSAGKKKRISLKEKRKSDLKRKKKKHLKNAKSSPPSPQQQTLDTLLGFYQTGQFEHAEKLAARITEKFPKHQFAWKVLGAILKQTERVHESVIANRKSVQLAPQDPEAHFNLGNTFKMVSRLDEAEKCFRQAIALQPHYAEAYNNLGNTLKEKNKLIDAKTNFRQAISLHPEYAEAHFNLGFIYQEIGSSEEAETEYRKAIALRSNFAEAHSNLGNALREQGRLEEAKVSLDQALSLRPDFTEALMSRWQVLFDQEKFDAALEDADRCNTEVSRACGLETLYALGRHNEIYRRIRASAELDDQNIRTAAFSCFISEIKSEDTAHNFCRNPMRFLQFSNVSSHLENSQGFLEELIEELKNIDTVWQPAKKTTINGFQTRTDINLFRIGYRRINQLESIIMKELDRYHLKFQNDPCSFIKKWPSKKVLNGWHVILKTQGHQDSHIHADGWLSGVIYLQVVPALENQEGAIEFSLGGVNYSHPNVPRLIYQPELGDIVFFPSSLHHRTIPFTTDSERIVISFDLIPQARADLANSISQ